MNVQEIIQLLRVSSSKLPQLRYAWGLLGLSCVSAIIIQLLGETRASILFIALTVVGSVIVFVLTIAFGMAAIAKKPAQLLLWSITLFFITFLSFTVSAFALSWPCNWVNFLDIQAERCEHSNKKPSDVSFLYQKAVSQTWLHKETRRYASPALLIELDSVERRSYFAIDDGLMFYYAPSHKPINWANVAISTKDIGDIASFIPAFLQNPSSMELRSQSGSIFYEKPFEDYLQQRAQSGANGVFETKVGLRRFLPPVNAVNQHLTLEIVPVSFWIIREFNRNILEQRENSHLMELREKAMHSFLSSGENLNLSFPSALYFEASILTKDNKLVLIKKDAKYSSLARIGKPLTCGFEEGLVWWRDVKDNGRVLNINHSLVIGAAKLGIKETEIKDVAIYGFALEAMHLNTAIIANVAISLTAQELSMRLDASREEEHLNEYRFISKESAFNDLFANPIEEIFATYAVNSQWHPTCRLRLWHASQGKPV